MSNCFLSAAELSSRPVADIGGKAAALARLSEAGFTVPTLGCVTTAAYRDYVAKTGVRERLVLEMGRKDFNEMRWEEIWDTALRIRHIFVTTPVPAALAGRLIRGFRDQFDGKSVAVRSSAPGEDAASTSFAGLHDSYLNIAGETAILDHVRLVWASLWSHRALLYRRELGLDVSHSAMAVVIQELVSGDCSGVVFSRDPTRPSRAVIEAVHGLNEGLVDGQVEPDRWILDRDDGRILRHMPPERTHRVVPRGDGTMLEKLPGNLADRAPLSAEQTTAVWQLGAAAEKNAGAPQDVEWTFRKGTLFTLQARPITTFEKNKGDSEREWYLSLERTLENLQALRQHIEETMLPGMEEDARRFSRIDPKRLDDAALAEALETCESAYEGWRKEYWESCIPFAHGMRLFGEVYTDRMRPADPYEFVELLKDDRLLSVERNRALQSMADILRTDHDAQKTAAAGRVPDAIRPELETFQQRYGAIMQLSAGQETESVTSSMLRLLSRMATASRTSPQTGADDPEKLRMRFVSSFPEDRRDWAAQLLDIARSSYRLRDDDNVYMGRVEGELERFAAEARQRLAEPCGPAARGATPGVLAELLKDADALVPPTPENGPAKKPVDPVRYRQLVGQPAGPGTAEGRARVIAKPEDFYGFEEGEILVCDAVDPTITFVVPLATAVVERRGGMLIHGAIIAREYGLPCVTGIPDVTERIPNGAHITVDGYLGIVTVDTGGLEADS